MKTVSLVLLLVASGLSAPQGDTKPVSEDKEAKDVAQPEARALAQEPTLVASTPYQTYQFGARVTPFYQPQHQYIAGHQNAYVRASPVQSFVSATPFYNEEAYGAKFYQGAHNAQYYHGGQGAQYYQDGAYYQHSAPAHFAQTHNILATKKVVQPAPAVVGVHHEVQRFAAPGVVRAQAAPVAVKAAAPAFSAPAPAFFGIHQEAERFAAPGVVRAHSAPLSYKAATPVFAAPAPAFVGIHQEAERFSAPGVIRAHSAPLSYKAATPVFAAPTPAFVGIHQEVERFAAPSVVKAPVATKATAHITAAPVAAAPAPAHIFKGAHAVPHPAAVEPLHVIVKQANDDNFDGSFAYSYETDHGISVESTGYLKNAGTPDQVQVMQGSYTYYTPEGVPIITTYIADENGFQVQGDHLPVAPAMPEAIAKSIEYQRSLPPSAEELAEQERSKVYDKY